MNSSHGELLAQPDERVDVPLPRFWLSVFTLGRMEDPARYCLRGVVCLVDWRLGRFAWIRLVNLPLV